MKVKELIELLQMEDENTEVYFSYDYGDHCHHEVAVPVTDVAVLAIKYSAYTDSDCLMCLEDGYTEEDLDNAETGIILRSGITQ